MPQLTDSEEKIPGQWESGILKNPSLFFPHLTQSETNSSDFQEKAENFIQFFQYIFRNDHVQRPRDCVLQENPVPTRLFDVVVITFGI